MAVFHWEGNTKEIFDKVISMTPLPFRKISTKNLTEALVKRVGEGGTITEQIMIECIKKVTPKPFLAMGMKQIKPMLKNG